MRLVIEYWPYAGMELIIVMPWWATKTAKFRTINAAMDAIHSKVEVQNPNMLIQLRKAMNQHAVESISNRKFFQIYADTETGGLFVKKWEFWEPKPKHIEQSEKTWLFEEMEKWLKEQINPA